MFAHGVSSYKSFSLTHELPNAILRWMGVADHQDLGERESKDLAMGLGVTGGQGLGGGLARAATGAGKGKRGGGKEGGDEPDGDPSPKNTSTKAQSDPNAGSEKN